MSNGEHLRHRIDASLVQVQAIEKALLNAREAQRTNAPVDLIIALADAQDRVRLLSMEIRRACEGVNRGSSLEGPLQASIAAVKRRQFQVVAGGKS